MLAILWKDLRIELRTKETLAALLLLGLLTLVVLSFAFDPTSPLREAAAPGVLWVALIFAGTLGMNRSLLREREADCLQGLLLAPVDRGSIYLAKTAGNFLVMIAAQLVLVPIFVFFFNLPFWQTATRLTPVVALGLLGFAAVGTMFAAVSLRTRAREVMLPLLMLPLAAPLIIAGIQASAQLMGGATVGAVSHWLNLLGAFDAVFLVVGWMAFEYVVEE
ncbi:MAG: heme exporter protein CcmB [Deltaproteobacteria bacterium]|nr:heme exporter protein CcmB [Deltaproteobacteria bacterium]